MGRHDSGVTPRPPGVPNGPGPNRSCSENHGGKDHPNLHAGSRQMIPTPLAGDEISHTTQKHTEESEEAVPGNTDVKIEYALNIAHFPLGGSVKKGSIQGHHHQEIKWNQRPVRDSQIESGYSPGSINRRRHNQIADIRQPGKSDQRQPKAQPTGSTTVFPVPAGFPAFRLQPVGL